MADGLGAIGRSQKGFKTPHDAQDSLHPAGGNATFPPQRTETYYTVMIFFPNLEKEA